MANQLPDFFSPQAITVVMYHAVSNIPGPYTISPIAFRGQVEFIKRNYHVVRLQDVPQLLSNATEATCQVALTFDDAFADLLDDAIPTLHELSLPCTIFVPSGLVGRSNEWDSQDPDAVRRPIMTEHQLRTLASDPLIDFGSHSVDHKSMAALTIEEMRAQAEVSRSSLESLTERPVTMFAYPYGQLDDFSPLTTQVLQETGYQTAVTTHWGTNRPGADPLTLRRIWFREEDTERRLKAKLDGGYKWITAKERLGYCHRSLKRRLDGADTARSRS